MGLEIKERVAGIDLMDNLVRLANKKNYNCFFLGAKEQVVKKIIDHYSVKYSNQVIAGYRNGYFDIEEEKMIIDQIIKSRPNFLFILNRPTFPRLYRWSLKNNLFMMPRAVSSSGGSAFLSCL